MSDTAERVANKLLDKEECCECGGSFPKKDMWKMLINIARHDVTKHEYKHEYRCKKCEWQYACTID